MSRLEAAVERIKTIECPTGEVGHRIADMLEDCGVADKSEISINRDKSLDRDGAHAYCASITGSMGKSIVILAKSGYDDYVAKIENAYIK